MNRVVNKTTDYDETIEANYLNCVAGNLTAPCSQREEDPPGDNQVALLSPPPKL